MTCFAASQRSGPFATIMGPFATVSRGTSRVNGTFCNNRGPFATRFAVEVDHCVSLVFYATIMRKYAERRRLCKNMRF